ncbi:hypothetical protein [Aeromicrobium stalagmiti]|uniref:hypothetical protein n=1 Tax=Aeromicrobium stalagmiti TaxID=2738988 RepID=UPI001569BAD9|nr:hypothetical protein [Aeromicrobium stalagmiti]NRQ48907.1 hypothetical protein [Aeromicrobium stalagmiti]
MTSTRELRHVWTGLPAARPADLVGTFEASFVRPLTHVSPPGLGLLGLPRWYGKRFTLDAGTVHGLNLVRPRAGGGLTTTLPMNVEVAASYADGRPCLAITYDAGAPRPWRWVRDEVRPWTDDRYVALTFVSRPGLRRLPGVPFLLTRR